MAARILSIVIRLTGVTTTRETLERRLGLTIDRYEPNGTQYYGQIDIEGDQDYWAATLTCLQNREAIFQELISESAIESGLIDVAIAFPDIALSTSSIVPIAVLKAAARAGLEISYSIYSTTTVEE